MFVADDHAGDDHRRVFAVILLTNRTGFHAGHVAVCGVIFHAADVFFD